LIDAIPSKLKVLKEKVDDLLTLNVDSYTTLKDYNDVGLKQTAIDLTIKGCALEDVRIIEDPTNSLTSAHPSFWSSTEIGISYKNLPYSVPPQTTSGVTSSYRTYDLSTGLLSVPTSISLSALSNIYWSSPIKKFSAGYLVSGTDSLGRGNIFKYNTTFASKSDLAITLSKDVRNIPWYLISDVIYYSYYETVAGANDVTIPQIITKGYDMTGSLVSTVGTAYHPLPTSSALVLKYDNYILQPRTMFGRFCLIVTNTTTGQIYYLPTELMNMFGIQGSTYAYSASPTTWAGYQSWNNLNPGGQLHDMFVDTKIHLLGVMYNTNTVVYMKFGWL
jgi:hypothetical protein